MTTATAALTGNSGGGSGSTTTATSGSGSGTAAGGGGGSGSNAASTSGWWDSAVNDPGTKEWLGTKKFPSVNEALTSYRNLEQMFGADRAGRTLLRPKDDNDTDGWNSVAKALGVPESADGYKLPVPEGADGGFARTASDWFHKAGVPPRAANLIANEWNSWIKAEVERGEAADRAESDRQMSGLRAEWGQNFDARRDNAQRAYRALAERLGLSDTANLERAESVLGAANLIKLFDGLGQIGSEHNFARGDAKNSVFGTNASDAKRQIDDIRARRMKGDITDDQWRETYEKQVLELGAIIANAA